MSRRPLGCLFEIAETLALTIIIFLVIQNFVAQPYRVEQQSMEHTLQEGQYVLVDKLTPRFDDYSRGDIVVFTPPEGGDDVPYIKRVIGVAGDAIAIDDGVVHVNGQPIDETAYTYDQEPTIPQDGTEWVIPPGTVFVMGDHRQESRDSRSFGPIPTSSVIGRAWLRYWPITALKILDTPRYPELPTAAGASPIAGASPVSGASPAAP